MTQEVLIKKNLSYEDACSLATDDKYTTEMLLSAANQLRVEHLEQQFHLCTIVNGKSGKCSENCRFCAQSAHYQTEVETYELIDEDQMMTAAHEAEQSGVHCFSIVTSGRELTDALLEQLVPLYTRLKSETNLNLCASHGMLTQAQALTLKALGVSTYHHNLETSQGHYPAVCTTHDYQVRIETIEYCQKAGLNVCSGGIIGIGEKMQDRIEMFMTLRDLGVKSIPMNILMPVEGTPMALNVPVDNDEILRTLAMARLILKDASIRIAGGRLKLGEDISKALKGGVNALMVGNYLTTVGNNITQDIEMLSGMGYKL